MSPFAALLIRKEFRSQSTESIPPPLPSPLVLGRASGGHSNELSAGSIRPVQVALRTSMEAHLPAFRYRGHFWRCGGTIDRFAGSKSVNSNLLAAQHIRRAAAVLVHRQDDVARVGATDDAHMLALVAGQHAHAQADAVRQILETDAAPGSTAGATPLSLGATGCKVTVAIVGAAASAFAATGVGGSARAAVRCRRVRRRTAQTTGEGCCDGWPCTT